MPKKRLFKARFSGYIAILLCITIPILFFGIKYVLDTSTKNAVKLETDVKEYHKKCAKEIALAVAQNWNPGLTLTQQKDAIMKIADAIYNASLNQDTSVLGKAIPGLDIKKDHKITSNSTFGGIVVTPQTIVSAPTTAIEYSNQTKYFVRLYSQSLSGSYCTWNPYFAMWRTIDKGTDPANRISIFDEVDTDKQKDNIFTLIHHDIYTIPLIYYGYMSSAYPTNSYYYTGSTYSRFYLSAFSKGDNLTFSYSPQSTLSYSTLKYSATTSTYKERINPSDLYCVQISISNDKIKAQTNIDTGYAVPAQCNVDIVLAIPTNGAANNISNRDTASDTSGSPYYGVAATSIPTNAAGTPIYQIGQACKNFVKDNFYHIRGINIGLIPYSAKVSISPDKTGYTVAIPQFVSTYFANNTIASNVMRGAYIYGTRGEKDAKLTNSYNWNTNLVGCPIMCRRGSTTTSTTYGNNIIFYGDLLSNANPSTTSLRFHRMNLNPCYLGYANLLSLKCESNCTVFLPNPYYMIELTADLVKIYEMCNALYPIYDPYNVSNFIFIPVTWANNLFQSWTNNPSLSATTDQLSRPSKTTSGRKKALILVVNKPDWFEPRELTYVGFNNDFSEFLAIESDKINFAINYSDTTKKFPDGTSYNGTIQGAKKILKYTTQSGTVERNATSGYYECAGSAVGRLSFPEKGLLKIVVANGTGVSATGSGFVTFYSDNIGTTYNVRKDSTSGSAITLGSSVSFSGSQKFIFSGPEKLWNWSSTYAAIWGNRSTNGMNFGHNLSIWKARFALGSGTIISSITLTKQVLRAIGGYDEAKSQILNNLSECVVDSVEDPNAKLYVDPCIRLITNRTDGIGRLWSRGEAVLPQSVPIDPSCYGIQQGKFGISVWTNNQICGTYAMETGNNSFSNLGSLNGYGWWIISSLKSPYYNDKVTTLITPTNTSSNGNQMNLGGFFFINNETKLYSSSATKDDIIYNKCIGVLEKNGEKWICFCGDGELEVTISVGAALTFSGVTGDSSLHKIARTETFYVEPSQITQHDGTNYYIDLNMSGLKLISAEITNRPYTKVTPACSISGTTNALNTSGTLQITTNLEAPMTIKAKTTTSGVTFYSDNGVEENINTYYPIDASTTKIITFSGPTRMYNWADSTYTFSQYTTTGGKNFGHNLKIYKLKYKLDNATISSATLTNQILRCYANYTSGTGDTGRKTLILNTDGHCTSETSSSSEQYTDPCISTNGGNYNYYNSSTGWIWNGIQIKAYNFYPICYGVQKVKFLMTPYNCTSTVSTSYDNYLKIYASGNVLTNVASISSSSYYRVFDLSGYTSYYTDRVQIFTGRFQTSYISARYYDAIRDVALSGTRQYVNNNGSESCTGDCSVSCSGSLLSSWADGPSGCACGSTCRYSTTCTKQYNSSGSTTADSCPSGYTLSQYSSSTGYIPTRYDIRNFFFVNTQTKSYSASATLAQIKANTYIGSLISGSDTWLCFCGDGQLRVTVANPKQPGTIQYTTPQNTTATTSVSKADYQTITIDPSTHQYVKNHTNNTYTITLNVNNIAIDTSHNSNKGVAFAEEISNYVYIHSHPTKPEMSRAVDFSKNIGEKPDYDTSLIPNVNLRYISYNKNLAYWSTQVSNYPYSEFYNNNIVGDFYFLLEDTSSIAPQIRFFNRSLGPETFSNVKCEIYDAVGLHRRFQAFPDIRNENLASFDIVNAHLGGHIKYIYAGFTLPINTALYYGADGTTLYKYQWQRNSSGTLSTYDPSVACQKVTTNACSKLKTDFGSNIKIYIIKYRKQTSYKNKISGSATNFDYSYIDTCASSSANIYDISTETDLKSSLDKIAADIKTFAGYADAKNVD